MVTQIAVNLELGHVAKTLDVPTPSGHTHEWMVFVKGADGLLIQHFVEKVVFWLHDSYEPPKWVVKSPPYQVEQSGYAGFNILIDIHFRNKSEPKTVRFRYDLFLHKENMPPVNHTRVEMLTFTNPADDFKRRLIKAGGIVKFQEAQPKEKKSHKEVRASEDRHGHSGKEKYDSEKSKQKHVRVDSKPSKSSGRSEEKRRGSVSDVEPVKRKKHEDRPTAPSPHATSEVKVREKEKAPKLKIKVENLPMSNLFSREESINIKQIKKKEIPKEEGRKEKRVEVKVKKEVIPMKQQEVEKKRKPGKEQSVVMKKPKPHKDVKTKRPRTVSSTSSDSDVTRRRKISVASSLSGSDSEPEVKAKKHSKPEKMKVKKPTKRPSPERHAKKSSSNRKQKEAMFSSDAHKAPSHVEKSSGKQSKTSHKSSGSGYDKKRKHASSEEKKRVNDSRIKVNIKPTARSTTPLLKKEKHKSSRSSASTPKVESISRERKHTPTPPQHNRKLEKKHFHLSPETSSSSEDEMDAPVVEEYTRSAVSPASSVSSFASESPHQDRSLFNPPEEQEELMDTSNEDPPSASSEHHIDESDAEQNSFEHDNPAESLDGTQEVSSDDKVFASGDHSIVSDDEPPATRKVLVGMGEEPHHYPHMNDQLFDHLRHIQAMLAAVTDEDRIRKISSIVLKSGNGTSDGDMMGFDLCSLDQKTIHKIKRQLMAGME